LLYAKYTKGIKRLSREERMVILIPDNIREIITGILLSDGHLERRSEKGNVRFIFDQSGKLNKRPYFELVYSLFKFYCSKDFEYYERI
jgi:LAGLIDADG DNA endonuclease family